MNTKKTIQFSIIIFVLIFLWQQEGGADYLRPLAVKERHANVEDSAGSFATEQMLYACREMLFTQFNEIFNSLTQELRQKITPRFRRASFSRPYTLSVLFDFESRKVFSGGLNYDDDWWYDDRYPTEAIESHSKVIALFQLIALDIVFSELGPGPLAGQDKWLKRFNEGRRDTDTLTGISPVWPLGDPVPSNILPSFRNILRNNTRVGILLETLFCLYPKEKLKLLNVDIGFDADKVYERLFEMGKRFPSFNDFITYLNNIFGEDNSLTQEKWIEALINNTEKRNQWLQAVFDMVLPMEEADQRFERFFIKSTDESSRTFNLENHANPWNLMMQQATNPYILRHGFPASTSPWASNNLRLNNGFWVLGPEKALGLVSKGIHGGLNKCLTEQGFSAPEHDNWVRRGVPFFPLSTSALPYGGIGWGTEIAAYFIKDGLNVADTDSIRDLKARYPEFTSFCTDKDEVVAKNRADWVTLKYLFVSKEIFLEYYERLSQLNLLDRVVVIDMYRNGMQYYFGNNQENKKTLMRNMSTLTDSPDDCCLWQMAARLVVSDVFKKEYRQKLVGSITREARILAAAAAISERSEQFSPEQVARDLEEDLDIVVDVLSDSKLYKVISTTIDYCGKREVFLIKAGVDSPTFSWADISRNLSDQELTQFEKAKKEYSTKRALAKRKEAYPERIIGRYDKETSTISVLYKEPVQSFMEQLRKQKAGKRWADVPLNIPIVEERMPRWSEKIAQFFIEQEEKIGRTQNISYLGSGAHSVVFDLGNGNILAVTPLRTITYQGSDVDWDFLKRQRDNPLNFVNQVIAAVKYGEDLLLVITPKLKMEGVTQDDVTRLKETAFRAGYLWSDPAPDNAGFNAQGKVVISDLIGINAILQPASSINDATTSAVAIPEPVSTDVLMSYI